MIRLPKNTFSITVTVVGVLGFLALRDAIGFNPWLFLPVFLVTYMAIIWALAKVLRAKGVYR